MNIVLLFSVWLGKKIDEMLNTFTAYMMYWDLSLVWEKEQTCIGVQAIRTPATPPPKTRPSGPANETLSPPVRVRWPPISCTRNDPDSDSSSNRPCGRKQEPSLTNLLLTNHPEWLYTFNQNKYFSLTRFLITMVFYRTRSLVLRTPGVLQLPFHGKSCIILIGSYSQKSTYLVCGRSTWSSSLPKTYIWYRTICWKDANSSSSLLRECHNLCSHILKKQYSFSMRKLWS